MTSFPNLDFNDVPMYQHEHGVLYSRGVKHLVDTHGLLWLLDTIALYHPTIRINNRSIDFQVWQLRVSGLQGVLTCSEDIDMPPLWTKQIDFTNCPFDLVTLLVESDVVLLPSEH